MSSTPAPVSDSGDADTNIPPLTRYAPGAPPGRYSRFAEEVFNLRLAQTQREILDALEHNQRTLVLSGNGVGKSYAVAAGIGAFLFTNPNSTVSLTSGTYSVLDDTIWKPLKNMVRRAKETYPLPHRDLENPPRLVTDQDEEWFFKAISPTHPKNLEGRHNERMLSVIEEADSPDITEAHVDSVLSTVTDAADRAMIVANPPDAETGIVYDLLQRDNWEVIQFDSFQSHNVRVDAGLIDAEKIPGLVDLAKLTTNYEAWHNRPWPGFEAARSERETIDARWAKRRLGIIPPESASAHRPITVTQIEAAFDRPVQDVEVDGIRSRSTVPQGLGFDVARMGGDSNVLAAVYRDRLDILDTWRGVDHTDNEARVRNQLGAGWNATLAVDATGEGSGLGDRLQTWYPDTHRFNAGGTAADDTEFKDCWSEGLYHLGQFLKSGSFDNRRLREELLAAARTIEYDEKYYASREATVLNATSKSAIKAQLGRSPDVLDAAMQAVWAAKVDRSVGIPEPGGTWYNPA